MKKKAKFSAIVLAAAMVLTAAGASLTGLPAARAEAASSAETVDMYRLYNRNTGEHFYTANVGERNQLIAGGWKDEGIGWVAPKTSSTPVYRLNNPNSHDHHYTVNPAEKDLLVKAGWNYEGIGWYSDDSKRVPLYRQYNPNAKTGNHNYTTNPAENDFLVANGWKAESIGWYGVAVGRSDNGASQPDTSASSGNSSSNSGNTSSENTSTSTGGVTKANTGSLGFFQSEGASDAVDILQENTAISSYTHIGAAEDATSLDNMKKALDFIDECNTLRAKHGLPALKVTDAMMAVSQVQCNASATTMNHTQEYNVGENLAWGYRDPFDGWYTEEKKEYDSGNRNYSEVGHYLNIIDSDYAVTGFAMNQYGSYGVTHEQSFHWGTSGTAYTVDEYRARFMEYYNQFK